MEIRSKENELQAFKEVQELLRQKLGYRKNMFALTAMPATLYMIKPQTFPAPDFWVKSARSRADMHRGSSPNAK